MACSRCYWYGRNATLLVITAALTILFAIFKAVADTLAHHFDTSVFRRRNTAFWNPLHRDNDYVKRVFSYPLDAWHISNSLMIICFALATVFNDLKYEWYWQVSGIGVVFMLTFGIFYNKILRR